MYDDVSDLLLTCQVAALIEIINPLVGIVKTGAFAPFMQVFGRNFTLMLLIVPEKSLHTDNIVLLLFIAWSAIEVIRYPFYLMNLHRYGSYVLTWLRYSAWIILYPTGMLCEIYVVCRSILLPKTSERWLFSLPNRLNISFSLVSMLQWYLCFFVPMGLYLLKHMFILRQRKLGPKRKVKSS